MKLLEKAITESASIERENSIKKWKPFTYYEFKQNNGICHKELSPPVILLRIDLSERYKKLLLNIFSKYFVQGNKNMFPLHFYTLGKSLLHNTFYSYPDPSHFINGTIEKMPKA